MPLGPEFVSPLPNLLCLGIDTTGNWCSAALVDEAKIFALQTIAINHKSGAGQGEVLAPMVQELLTAAGVAPADIGKISVCTGPGSFSGVRIGLSFAKGFALPHGIPVVGVSALEVWAAAADPEQNKSIFTAADIRRQQVFWQVWKNGEAVKPPQRSDAPAAQKHVKNMDTVGSGAALLDALPQTGYICPARLAWLGLEKNAETHPATPLYHRPPDAKLPGGKSLT